MTFMERRETEVVFLFCPRQYRVTEVDHIISFIIHCLCFVTRVLCSALVCILSHVLNQYRSTANLA
jgi:hypothetical protein